MNVNKKFLLKSKKFYLIYKNINQSINNKKERFLSQLMYKFIHLNYYLIGEEKNTNGTSNIYCFIELENPFQTSLKDFFDIYLDGLIFKGDYRPGLRKKQIISYILEKNSYITNK